MFLVSYHPSYEWDYLKNPCVILEAWIYSCEGAIWIGRCENIGLSAQLLRCQETNASYFFGWRKLFSMQLWMYVTIRVLLIKSNILFTKSTLKETFQSFTEMLSQMNNFHGAKALFDKKPFSFWYWKYRTWPNIPHLTVNHHFPVYKAIFSMVTNLHTPYRVILEQS